MRIYTSYEDKDQQPKWKEYGLYLIGIDYDAVESEFGVAIACKTYLSVNFPVKFNGKIHKFMEELNSKLDIDKYDGINFVRLGAHDQAIWWEFMHSDNSWKSGTPKWRSGNFNPLDYFLGSKEHSKEVVSSEAIEIAMPEKTYKWKVDFLKRIYKRKRFPWPEVIHCYSADCLEGEQIPHPGKGENSWDCEEGATFGMSGPGKTIEEVIGKITETVWRSRRRHGGKNWKPEGKK
jgi:hypothetical protein